ncbi:MAG: FlgD immunoglobulin-like domain containing protein [bacterium]
MTSDGRQGANGQVEVPPPSSVESDITGGASNFSLQVTPNPASQQTRFRYHLPSTNQVTVRIYDVAGRLIRTFSRGNESSGWHELVWNRDNHAGRRTAAGVYFCTLQIGSEVNCKELLWLD